MISENRQLLGVLRACRATRHRLHWRLHAGGKIRAANRADAVGRGWACPITAAYWWTHDRHALLRGADLAGSAGSWWGLEQGTVTDVVFASDHEHFDDLYSYAGAGGRLDRVRRMLLRAVGLGAA